MRDLHALPKLSDSLSYLYAEHCIVEKQQEAVELFDQDGATRVPAAALSVLLLGPGTRITHAAVKVLADNGCTIVWVGEDGTRCYAQGGGETRKGYQLLHQARLATDPALRLEVCKRMYRMRFADDLDDALSIEQLRGMEGARVRSAYARFSIRHGVSWHGRAYDRATWGNSDPINRAISAANALLNGLCHAAIVSAGYSPGLGFIHTGKQLSFVYDIADLYKVEITLPVAFRIVGQSPRRVESRIRRACRQAFREARLLRRILPDIKEVLAVPDDLVEAGAEADADPARPEPLWDPPAVTVPVRADAPSMPKAASEPAPATVACPASSEAPSRQVGAEPPVRMRSDDEAVAVRRHRAERGLDSGWQITQLGPDEWHIVTRPSSDGYHIRREGERLMCECPDFAKTGLGLCKHTLAIEMVDQSMPTSKAPMSAREEAP